MAKVVADQSARQGRKGKPVLIVLAASMLLLAVYMIGFMTWSGSTTPDSPQQNSSQQTTAPGASSSSTSGVPAANPAYPAPAAPASGTAGSAPPR